MAIKRERRVAENSESDDTSGDDSASGDDWALRSAGGGDGGINAKTARTDVAVDYSIASSSSSSSSHTSSVTRPANTPRRHTGPRKPRANVKVCGFKNVVEILPCLWGTGIKGLKRGMATLPEGNQELLVVRDKVGRPPGELGVSKSMECDIFPFSALRLLVRRQEGHPACL